MSTNKEAPAVIEITDSSDECDNIVQKKASSTPKEARASSKSTPQLPDRTDSTASSSSQLPKKVHNRRKSLHQSIRSMENISFESVITRGSKADNNSEERINESKKRRWGEDGIEPTEDDPEMTRMLKKIAYCRVFTNYLLRQYDMLAIDFKLYSNIHMLMLELKKRVDTYTSIRRSRQRLLLNREILGNLQ